MSEQLAENPLMAEILRNRYHIIPDPAPPWILNHLDRKQVFQLASVELEMRKTIFEAVVKATARAAEIVQIVAAKAAG